MGTEEINCDTGDLIGSLGSSRRGCRRSLLGDKGKQSRMGLAEKLNVREGWPFDSTAFQAPELTHSQPLLPPRWFGDRVAAACAFQLTTGMGRNSGPHLGLG